MKEDLEVKCSSREGRDGCIWWVTGCIHPEVLLEVKRACSKSIGQLRRKEKENEREKIIS